MNGLLTLAQDDSAAAAGVGIFAGIFGCFFFLIYLAIVVVCIIGMWKVFTKAGKPGWAILIPIYNMIVMLEIVGRPLWWIILLLIPIVNIIIGIIITIDMAKSFGKDIAFAIGLILLGPIFYCILGFGSATYLGPAAASPAAA